MRLAHCSTPFPYHDDTSRVRRRSPVLSACLAVFTFMLLTSPQAFSREPGKKHKSGRYEIRHKQYRLRLVPRTPEQIAAFYYGRGFPQRVIRELKKVCFITVGMRNLSKDILWLDFRHWKFSSQNSPVRILWRKDWLAKWQKMKVPKNFQATFRWTVLPPQFDFQPHEREGGNIILPRTGRPFTIHGTLFKGKNRDKGKLKFVFHNVRCATDQPRRQ